MKVLLGILLLCFVAFAASQLPKGRELHKMLRNRASKLGRVACNKGFQNCTKAATDEESKKVCLQMLKACKEKIMEMISKTGQVRPTGKQGGGKHGGRKQGRRPGPKQHFCQCFKRLVVCIKKHHNKTMTDKDGQKITVHEDIFINAQSAVAGPGQAGMGSMEDPMSMDPRKQCVRRFRCCLQRQGCGGQRGKGRKRKQRDSNKMGRKGKRGRGRPERRGGKGGRPRPSQRPGPRPGPFRSCVAKAKKCKQDAGKSKKKLKLCAKNFVKCMLKICSKGKKN